MSSALKTNVAIEVLRGKCYTITSQEEADVITKMLEHLIHECLGYKCLSAPEVNVMASAAIIRTANFSLNLINPVIIEKYNHVVHFGESCASFPYNTLNCIRYNDIVLQTGMERKTIKLSGEQAFLAQHAIDHLNSSLFYDKTVKLAVVREGGIIKRADFCPCGSKKRFISCCMK